MTEVEYFIGGAADKNDILSAVMGQSHIMRSVSKFKLAEITNSANFTVVYKGHEDENLILSEIKARKKAKPSLVINITVHSWGGQAAIRITQKLALVGIHVNQLITLDPVSLLPLSQPKPAIWVNVYQSQSILDDIAVVPVVGNVVSGVLSSLGSMLPGSTQFDDTIATTGGQLGAQTGAINIETELHHQDALEMYRIALARIKQIRKVKRAVEYGFGF